MSTVCSERSNRMTADAAVPAAIPARDDSQGSSWLAMLATASLSISGCTRSGGDPAPNPTPEVSVGVVRSEADLPGPYAPHRLQPLVNDIPLTSAFQIREPGQAPGTFYNAAPLTPQDGVIFRSPGTHQIVVDDPQLGRHEIDYEVQFDFTTSLEVESGSSVLGAGITNFSLKDQGVNMASGWELRAYTLSNELDIAPVLFNTAEGPSSSLESASGIVNFDPTQLAVGPETRVVYLQGSSLLNPDKASCLFAATLNYDGLAQYEPLGFDTGIGNMVLQRGEEATFRLHGAYGGAQVTLIPPGWTGEQSIEINFPPNTSGDTQEASVILPDFPTQLPLPFEGGIPTLWGVELVASRPDGNPSAFFLIPVLQEE